MPIRALLWTTLNLRRGATRERKLPYDVSTFSSNHNRYIRQAVANTTLDEDDRAPDQGIDQENLEAAEQGGPTAQNNIDQPGQGVVVDGESTLMRSDNAVEEGDVDGWGDLYKANIYASGDGVPKDMKVAFEWTLKSAEKGNLYAQIFVGNWYYSGVDVSQDYGKAMQWLINHAN